MSYYSNSLEPLKPNPFDKPNPYDSLNKLFSASINPKPDRIQGIISNKIELLTEVNPFSLSKRSSNHLIQSRTESKIDMFPRFDQSRMTIIKDPPHYTNQNKTYKHKPQVNKSTNNLTYNQNLSYRSTVLSSKNYFVQKYGDPVSSFALPPSIDYHEHRSVSYNPMKQEQGGENWEASGRYSEPIELKERDKIESKREESSFIKVGENYSPQLSLDRKVRFSGSEERKQVEEKDVVMIKGVSFYPTKVNKRIMDY